MIIQVYVAYVKTMKEKEIRKLIRQAIKEQFSSRNRKRIPVQSQRPKPTSLGVNPKRLDFPGTGNINRYPGKGPPRKDDPAQFYSVFGQEAVEAALDAVDSGAASPSDIQTVAYQMAEILINSAENTHYADFTMPDTTGDGLPDLPIISEIKKLKKPKQSLNEQYEGFANMVVNSPNISMSTGSSPIAWLGSTISNILGNIPLGLQAPAVVLTVGYIQEWTDGDGNITGFGPDGFISNFANNVKLFFQRLFGIDNTVSMDDFTPEQLAYLQGQVVMMDEIDVDNFEEEEIDNVDPYDWDNDWEGDDPENDWDGDGVPDWLDDDIYGDDDFDTGFNDGMDDDDGMVYVGPIVSGEYDPFDPAWQDYCNEDPYAPGCPGNDGIT